MDVLTTEHKNLGSNPTINDRAVTVRLFDLPTLNLKANSYYKMVNLTSCHQQPPAIRHLTDSLSGLSKISSIF